MVQGFGFTEKGVKKIRDHLGDETAHRRNKPLRHPTLTDDPTAPEVYIAKPTSANGIPALTPEPGTGTEDTPGTDTADIYKINSDGDLIPVGFTKVVYNLTSTAIEQDSWTTIHRSKYGKWLILPEAVGGAYIAKPQSASGIPALTRDTGTGTDDVAGSDTCDIYQINESDEIVAVASLELEVFNITDEIIPQDWILIVKTNFGKWIAVPSTSGIIRRFELKETLTPGGSATAYLLEWSGSAYTEDFDIEFTVYDVFSRFRGLAHGAGTGEPQGSQGYARFFPDRGVWEILTMQPHALMVRCLTDEAVVAADASFDVDTVTIMQPTGAVLVADVTLVYNIFSWDIDINAIVVAVWNESTDHWEAIQVECPA